jgi:hypothetical protein
VKPASPFPSQTLRVHRVVNNKEHENSALDKPAEQGGATPIADDELVFQRLNPRIKDMYKVRY